MNGNDRKRRTALLSVLGGHIHNIECVSDLDILKVVLDPSTSEPT